MRVTDEEDCVIVRLQHLKKVNIRPTVDENEVSELQHTHTAEYYTQFRVTLHEKRQHFFIVNPSVNYSCFFFLLYLLFVLEESSSKVLPACYWHKCVLDLVTVEQCLVRKQRYLAAILNSHKNIES